MKKFFFFKFIENVNLTYLLGILSIVVLYVKLFFVHEHYPTSDEIVTFHRYLNWKGLFWKDAPNNHLSLSLIGTISNKIFGFNFILLRFYNFLFFSLILIIFCKIFNNLKIFLIFISIILFSDIIFNYIYLYRGYYISSALFVLIFYILFKDPEIKTKSLRYILFGNFLLFIHSIYTIYLVLPILISLLIIFIRKRKTLFFFKEGLKFFLAPSLFIYIIIFLVTGFVSEFSNNFTNFEKLNIIFLMKNFFLVFEKSIIPGFKAVFFNVYAQPDSLIQGNRITNIKNISLLLIKEQLTVFLIFLTSILFFFYNSLKNKVNVFDYIIVLFFLFFFILNKSPFLRVYVGLIYFFIFYVCLNINKCFFEKKNKENFFFKIFIKIIVILLLLFVKPNDYYQELKDIILKINKYDNNCKILNRYLNDNEKWILMNFYPGRCQYLHDREKNTKIVY